MTTDYIYDPVTRVHSRLGSKAFTYTDGEEVEIRLLNAIERAKDLSAASAELAKEIVDWPSEYHLSCTRHNLLRPISIGPEHRVLELGCGCGAMTRYLGETGATVVAVEGSTRRAQIAASRCRDLPNVTIYCDNLIDFDCEEKFDFVTLIGVLEYAPKFIKSDDPVGSCLFYARSFIKIDGALILAIENQLGLKYFNGCAEDHIGAPYYSINDLYENTDPITFGRHVLSTKLNRAGLPLQNFFYPFSDYKVPAVILNEAAFSDERFNTGDLLHRSVARDYTTQAHRTFHEQLAWRAIARNKLVSHLANSFLILAAPDERSPNNVDRSWLARAYTSERLPEFATETIFQACDTGIRVIKHSLYPELALQEAKLLDGNLLHQLPSDEIYIEGDLYISELQHLLARGSGVQSVVHWARSWIEKLFQNASYNAGEPMLDGEWLDAIPANFVRTPEGELVQIDREWKMSCKIPLGWVLIRGLTSAVGVCPKSPALARLTYRQVIEKTLAGAGFPEQLTDIDFVKADQYETALRTIVFGTNHSPHGIYETLDKPAVCAIGSMMFQDDLLGLQAEIQRIKSTVSWRITKPLRFVWNMLPRLLQSGSQSPYLNCSISTHVPDNTNEDEAYALLLKRFAPDYKDRVNGYIKGLLAIDHYSGRIDYLGKIIGSKRFHSGIRVLVSGYGAGSEMIAARQAGLGEIHGVEVDPIWVEVTRKRLESMTDVYPSHYDGRLLPYSDARFDMLLSGHVIEHTSDPKLYLHECMRVLATGGYLSLEFPHRYHHTELHTRLPSLEWLPRSMRDTALRVLSGCYSPLTAGVKERYARIVSTGLQQISMASVRNWLKSSGYPHTILDTTKAAPGITRCVVRKDAEVSAN